MKLLYLSREKFNNKLKSLFKSRGAETIHYKNPLKAIDNFQEIEPDMVVMVLKEFPRFWKIVLKSLRESYINSTFILVGKLDSDEEEAFNYLKGDGIIEGNTPELYKPYIKGGIKSDIYYPDEGEITLGFVNPNNFTFINGVLKEFNGDKVIFSGEDEESLDSLNPDDTINDASISIDDEVYSVDLKVISRDNNAILQFINMNDDFKNKLKSLFE